VNGSDAEDAGTFTIGLDPDTDHASGNEVFIHEGTLTTDAGNDSFSWEGDDLAGDLVAAGTYHLFAFVGDTFVTDHPVEAGVQITVSAQ